MRAFPAEVPSGVPFFVRLGLVSEADLDQFAAAADRVAVFRMTDRTQAGIVRGRPPRYASTSTSTRCSGSSSPATTTIVAAGRTSPKTALCARPTASACSRSVTYIRVRTTSPGSRTASASAASAIRERRAAVCAAGHRRLHHPTVHRRRAAGRDRHGHRPGPPGSSRNAPPTGHPSRDRSAVVTPRPASASASATVNAPA